MTASVLINIDVPDLDQAEAFYLAAFELKVSRRLKGRVVELVGAAVPIYLLEKAPGSIAAATTPDARNFARHWTPVHLDFAVQDLDAALERALAAGATLDDPPSEHAWGRIAFMADPFGNGFCLIQYSERGYDTIVVAQS